MQGKYSQGRHLLYWKMQRKKKLVRKMCVWGRTMDPMKGWGGTKPNQNSSRNKKRMETVRKNRKRMDDWKGKDLSFTPVQRWNFLLRGIDRLITRVC